jgi:DNA-binding SARP family transcriptional activator
MLELSLFGIFDARRDGQRLDGLWHRHAHQLLALLTLEHNHRVGRAWVQTILGINHDQLRQAEGILRQEIEDQPLSGREEERRVQVGANRICLNLKGVRVDIFEFEKLVNRGDTASLQAAVKLYRGGLLKDFGDEDEVWILERREEYQISYLDAIRTLAETAIRAGDYARAASYLRQFTRICPEMDAGWARLIEVYTVTGDLSPAEEIYRDYLAALALRGAEQERSLQPSPRIEELMRQFRDATPRFPATASALPLPPPPPARLPDFEPAGGAVPLGSPYYLARPADDEAHAALAQQASFILIKGARQVGKTSLLARILREARQGKTRVVRTDWQAVPQAQLETAHTFLLGLAYSLAEQLDLDASPEDSFHSKLPPTKNFDRFWRKQVFPALPGPLVWGIDEADRLFECDFRDDIFGMFRSWHNERSLDPEAGWQRVTMVLAYATEANLFIRTIYQSPFNVGFRVDLTDFTLEQVSELNRRYGEPLRNASEVERLDALVGGHPYLVRRSLQEMVLHRMSLADVEAHAERRDGIFGDHLERMRLTLSRDEDLMAAVRTLLKDGACPTDEECARLCASGVMVGSSPAEMRPRCRLYERFLRSVLR